MLDLTGIFKTTKINKEASRNYCKATKKSLGDENLLLRASCSSTRGYMVLYAVWHNIFLAAEVPSSQETCAFQSHLQEQPAQKTMFIIKLHLLRRSLTNMDWAQNRAQVTSLSLRKPIKTLKGKLWSPSPSTLYSQSSWRDPQNQPGWRVGWGINHFKNHYRQQGQRTCSSPLQLQPVVACIGTVLMTRKGYATTECGGSCCRVWLFHVQGTWDFYISYLYV